ncbi:MAG: hypothetical protein AAGF06_06385 [Pseudomonadota bacterium]
MTNKYLLLLPSVLSAILYGGIAYYVNSEHGRHAALIAGFTQAVASAVVTLSAAFLMTWMFAWPAQPRLKFLSSSLGSGVIVLSVFVVIHTIMVTPNVMATILPGLIIGTSYFLLFSLALYKQRL